MCGGRLGAELATYVHITVWSGGCGHIVGERQHATGKCKSDNNDEQEALDEFLHRELDGVDVEDVCFESSIATEQSADMFTSGRVHRLVAGVDDTVPVNIRDRDSATKRAPAMM